MRYQHILFAIAALASAGCGKVNLSVGGLTPTGMVLPLSTSAEFVATSKQGVPTINKYTVNGSSGESLSQLAQVTQNGYTVYTSVQGEFASDQIPATVAASAAAAAMAAAAASAQSATR